MRGIFPEDAVIIKRGRHLRSTRRTGGFGLIIGVRLGDDPEVLRQNGADIVVRDLAELSLV